MPLSRTGSGCCFFVGRIRQNVNKRPHDQGPLAKDYGSSYPSRLGYLAIYNTLRTYGYDMSIIIRRIQHPQLKNGDTRQDPLLDRPHHERDWISMSPTY